MLSSCNGHFKLAPVPPEKISPIHAFSFARLRAIHVVRQACRAAEALENAGASIDKECGLHVHFDAASFTANELRTACIR